MERVLKGYFRFIRHKFLKLKFLNLAMLEDQSSIILDKEVENQQELLKKISFFNKKKLRMKLKMLITLKLIILKQ